MTNIIVNTTNNNQIKENSEKFTEMYTKMFGKTPITKTQEERIDYNNMKLEDGKKLSIFEEKENYQRLPDYKIVGIIFSTYIILEMKMKSIF